MSYIIGTSLPEDKTLIYSLTYVYGIGLSQSTNICKKLGIGVDCKSINLTTTQLIFIENFIESSVSYTGPELSRFNKERIKRLCSMLTYRGLRHRRGLPVRGQRTHTNAKRRDSIKW